MAKALLSLRVNAVHVALIDMHRNDLVVLTGPGMKRLNAALRELEAIADAMEPVETQAGIAAWASRRRFSPLAWLQRLLSLRAL